MLICPECGNTIFPEKDRKAPFRCPIAGCPGMVEDYVVVRTEIPRMPNEFWSEEDQKPDLRGGNSLEEKGEGGN